MRIQTFTTISTFGQSVGRGKKRNKERKKERKKETEANFLSSHSI
jgi:hypothetical protein